jgi:hypothetical protein
MATEKKDFNIHFEHVYTGDHDDGDHGTGVH